MALAVHFGGPADGLTIKTDGAPQTRYYAKAVEREAADWVTLSRYVFEPPRAGRECRYRYTGQDQVKGPVPGLPGDPDWSL